MVIRVLVISEAEGSPTGTPIDNASVVIAEIIAADNIISLFFEVIFTTCSQI